MQVVDTERKCLKGNEELLNQTSDFYEAIESIRKVKKTDGLPELCRPAFDAFIDGTDVVGYIKKEDGTYAIFRIKEINSDTSERIQSLIDSLHLGTDSETVSFSDVELKISNRELVLGGVDKLVVHFPVDEIVFGLLERLRIYTILSLNRINKFYEIANDATVWKYEMNGYFLYQFRQAEGVYSVAIPDELRTWTYFLRVLNGTTEQEHIDSNLSLRNLGEMLEVKIDGTEPWRVPGTLFY